MINNVSAKLHELIESLSSNVTTLNRTLTSQIDWLSGDQKNNRVRNNVYNTLYSYLVF